MILWPCTEAMLTTEPDALLQHVRKHGPGEIPVAAQVDFQVPQPVAWRQLQRIGKHVHARVADQRIDGSEPSVHIGNESGHRLGIGDVTLDEDLAGSSATRGRSDLVVTRHARAMAGEQLRYGRADAVAGAGHDHALAMQALRGRYP